VEEVVEEEEVVVMEAPLALAVLEHPDQHAVRRASESDRKPESGRLQLSEAIPATGSFQKAARPIPHLFFRSEPVA
jgi:hypothetical protein